MTTFLAGMRLLAADLQNALSAHVGVTASAFSLPSSASVYTAVAFDTQSSSNTAGMWAVAAPTKLFAPTDGTYTLGGVVVWPATLSASDGRGQFLINSTGSALSTAKVTTMRGSGGNSAAAISGTAVMSAGQWLELYLNQNSGSTCSMIVALSMNRISTATS